jgi:hypothetical protein
MVLKDRYRCEADQHLSSFRSFNFGIASEKVGWRFNTHCRHRIIGKLCWIWIRENQGRRGKR